MEMEVCSVVYNRAAIGFRKIDGIGHSKEKASARDDNALSRHVLRDRIGHSEWEASKVNDYLEVCAFPNRPSAQLGGASNRLIPLHQSSKVGKVQKAIECWTLNCNLLMELDH